jgi:flavin reductase (DIM6/NTAB) family NADH-FMN oxidoreductase RutF
MTLPPPWSWLAGQEPLAHETDPVATAGSRRDGPTMTTLHEPATDLTATDFAGSGFPGSDISAAEFRHAMGHFASGVTVVTSIGPGGEPVGTTASAVTSLSLDPPLVLVCFDRASTTLEAVRAHGAFVVNVLAAPQRHLSANFARRGLAAVWDDIRHRPGPTGSPRLDGVLAAVECTVEESIPGGDHEIVVGRVYDVEISSQDAAPLLYWRGAYAALDEA